jgi:small subunit ribosomal protein S5
MAGVRNALTKSFGTTNPHNMIRATLNGLRSMRNPDDVYRERKSAGNVQ